MTALNIRRNLGNILRLAADAVDNAKVPEVKSIKHSIDSARVSIAKAVVPNDKAFVISKTR